ncbi:MAG: DUF167 domain-containing protein [Acidobacteriia bacterium]|nr:DUF167 domain-containing protein [Terriglobia bacterium]
MASVERFGKGNPTGDAHVDLTVKVVPRSSRSEVVGPMPDGTLKVKVAAVPEDGKANAELCRVLARHFQVPARNVEIVSGASSTRKRVRVLI